MADVGMTHQKLKSRLNKHVSRASQGFVSYSASWIRQLLSQNLLPTIREIETGQGEQWGVVEAKWIAHFKSIGARLTNLTTGGEGCPGHQVSPEAREKMRAARIGKPLSDKTKAKLRFSSLGKKMSPDAIERSLSKGAAFAIPQFLSRRCRQQNAGTPKLCPKCGDRRHRQSKVCRA